MHSFWEILGPKTRSSSSGEVGHQPPSSSMLKSLIKWRLLWHKRYVNIKKDSFSNWDKMVARFWLFWTILFIFESFYSYL